jgi:glutamine amidotransferase
MKAAIVDYGVGNLASVAKALRCAGADAERVSRPELIAGAGAIVIPGVGHFASTRGLNDQWRGEINAAVSRGVPVLGICLGMQWLFDGSTEDQAARGFAVFEGTCAPISGAVKVPHVGWNTLERRGDSVLLRNIPDGTAMYFTHSYAAPLNIDTVSTTTHGQTFASTVERDHIFGVQWHPEKSGQAGLAVLKNFIDFAGSRPC